METEIEDLLGQVLQHLNKLRQTQDLQQQRLSQLDHVTERLDTVQNVLETQNQRQGLLNEKLDQVNILLKEQLRYAQSDILTGITVLQSKLCSDGGREHVSQSVQKDQVPQDKNDMGPQLEDIVNSFHSRLNRLDTKVDILTNQLSHSKEDHVPQAKNYMGSQFEDIVSSFHGRLDRLNTKVESVTTLLSDNSQTSHKLIGISRKIETQLQSAVRNMQQESGSQERTVAKQKEVQELQDVIKGQTRAELVWLKEEVDSALVDMFAKLNDKLEMVHTKLTELEKISDHIQDVLCEQQNLLHSISSSRETMEDKLVQVKEAIVSEVCNNFQIFVKNENMNVKQEMLNELKETDKELLVLAEDNLKSHTDTASTGIKAEILYHLKEYMTRCENVIETVNNDQKQRSIDLAEDCCKLIVNLTTRKNTEQQEYIKQELMESVDKIKDHMDKVKYEMFAVTEKEAQLVRDYIENNVPLKQELHQKQETYTFDFYIPGFKSLVRSGKIVKSFPWHIRKFKTSMQGYVQFLITGEMVVWLMYFRNSLEVGLAPITCGTLHINALVKDRYNKNLEDLNIGEKKGNLNEEDIRANWDRGYKLGKLSGEDMVQKGYGEKEGYRDGAILIKYVVNVS